jgi:hypothetical protein
MMKMTYEELVLIEIATWAMWGVLAVVAYYIAKFTWDLIDELSWLVLKLICLPICLFFGFVSFFAAALFLGGIISVVFQRMPDKYSGSLLSKTAI